VVPFKLGVSSPSPPPPPPPPPPWELEACAGTNFCSLAIFDESRKHGLLRKLEPIIVSLFLVGLYEEQELRLGGPLVAALLVIIAIIFFLLHQLNYPKRSESSTFLITRANFLFVPINSSIFPIMSLYFEITHTNLWAAVPFQNILILTLTINKVKINK